jgi:glycosyltransferase involved in cell wall biosynthesis
VLTEYDILLFPTFYPNEGLSGILIEAMIAGIAPITTNYQSIPDLVQDGRNGLLVKPRDSANLAVSILTLNNDRELLQKISINNYYERLKYDSEKIIPKIMRALDYNGSDQQLDD